MLGLLFWRNRQREQRVVGRRRSLPPPRAESEKPWWQVAAVEVARWVAVAVWAGGLLMIVRLLVEGVA